jgi:hypothetical protein
MADGSYIECHLCQVSLVVSVEIRAFYAECRYAECRYAECHYAECRGAVNTFPDASLTSQTCLSYRWRCELTHSLRPSIFSQGPMF